MDNTSKYKYIQKAKVILTYPFRLFVLPSVFIFGVIFTNWEDKRDRDSLWELLRILYKPW